MTDDLSALGDWLAERQVSHDTMESTGVSWRPLWNRLEDLIHLVLHEALDHALKLGLVARNVAAATEPPRSRRPQVKT